jgi:actin-related protein 5
LKEKKKQKLLKAGFEARARARREKEKALEERAAEERKEDEERAADPSAWVRRVRAEHASVMDRIKERNRRKAALGDRKSAASQARMKSIASLAADERVGKKRRKGGGGACFCHSMLASQRAHHFVVQRICLVQMTTTGLSTARL